MKFSKQSKPIVVSMGNYAAGHIEKGKPRKESFDSLVAFVRNHDEII